MNKIIFKKIRFKNFMSFGNSFTNFQFENGMSLITGQNGFGKTASMTALFYNLYGKNFKKAKLGSLINEINNSEMVTESYFQINQDEYKIIRGQKPAIFEIYKNDKLVEQNATVAEYQQYLETYILQVPENAFRQLIFLGANVAGSKSFIELTKAEKEELFQIITDTSIFKVIKDSIKEKANASKTQYTETKYKIDVLTETLVTEKRNIQQMEEQNSKVQKLSKERIYQINERLSEINERSSKITEGLKKLKKVKDKVQTDSEKLSKIKEDLTTKESEFNRVDAELRKINSAKSAFSECIGCAKLNNIAKVDLSQEDNLTKQKELLQEIILNLTALYNTLQQEIQDQRQKLDKGRVAKEQLDNLITEQNRLKIELETINTQEEVHIDYSDLEKKETDIICLKETYTNLSLQLSNFKKLDSLLSNENLKGVIINQTLPILNKYINEYIQKFSDFDFNFYIDSNFKENVVLKSRNREFYTLSSGQGFRITFSILFAFLKIVEERNGVSTNICILDEILDSSLDSNGRHELLRILKEEFSYNKDVVIISHNQDIVNTTEYFNRVIRLEKTNNFSKLIETK